MCKNHHAKGQKQVRPMIDITDYESLTTIYFSIKNWQINDERILGDIDVTEIFKLKLF